MILKLSVIKDYPITVGRGLAVTVTECLKILLLYKGSRVILKRVGSLSGKHRFQKKVLGD